MENVELNVLYRKGRDLILFHFTYSNENYQEELRDLIDFHFCDRHDFNERVENCAESIFANFYEDAGCNEPELIDYEEIKQHL